MLVNESLDLNLEHAIAAELLTKSRFCISRTREFSMAMMIIIKAEFELEIPPAEVLSIEYNY